MIEIKMNNFPLNSINSKVFQNIMPKVMIILQLPLIILLNYFWKENSGKKYTIMLVRLFSALVRLFFIHLSIFYRKMPSLDKRKFYFIIKKPFLEWLNTRLFKSKLSKFFSVALHFVFISWRHRSEDNRKKRKNQKVRSPFCWKDTCTCFPFL